MEFAAKRPRRQFDERTFDVPLTFQLPDDLVGLQQ